MSGLGAYALNRLAMAWLVILVALSVNFVIPRLMPGDPVEQQLAAISAAGGQVGDMAAAAAALRERLGLDRPIFVARYWRRALWWSESPRSPHADPTPTWCSTWSRSKVADRKGHVPSTPIRVKCSSDTSTPRAR